MVAKHGEQTVNGVGLNKRGYRRDSNKMPIHLVVGSLLGRAYKLGGNGKENGLPFDCWGMINEYVRLRYSCELDPPSDEYPVENYKDYYSDAPEKVMSVFAQFMDEFFIKVNIEYRTAGDILLVATKDDDFLKRKHPTIGIYGGQGTFIVTLGKVGCVSINLNYYNVESAYRWPLRSQ